MPTYQYTCTTCAEQIEVVQRFSDDPLTVCPACGGALRKVFSPVGIVFKGSGFYRTDSRQAAAAAASGANGNGAKDGPAKESPAKESSAKDGPAGEGSAKDGSAREGSARERKAEGRTTAAGGSSADAKKPAGAKSSPPVGAGSSAS